MRDKNRDNGVDDPTKLDRNCKGSASACRLRRLPMHLKSSACHLLAFSQRQVLNTHTPNHTAVARGQHSCSNHTPLKPSRALDKPATSKH